MKLSLVLTGIIVLLSACQKSKDPIQRRSLADIPKKVILNFYDGNTLLKKWIYERDPSSTADRVTIYWTDSSYNNIPGHSQFFKARQIFEYNPAQGFFSRIISRNYNSGMIDHWVNDQVEPLENDVNNYTVSNDYDHDGAGDITVNLFKLDGYMDSLQQKKSDSHTVEIVKLAFNQTKRYEVYFGSDGPRYIWDFQKDSINLNESLTSPPGVNYYEMLRYQRYYDYELPWYIHKPVDKSTYYIRSPYVCDSLVLRNGDYVFPGPGAGIFQSSLERKIAYQYSVDTTAIKGFIDLINPVAKDPFWYFISASAHSFATFGLREEGNYTDLYNWMASRSTDSVFIMNNGKRIFKQVTFTTNVLEKDTNGRITKITNRTGNKSRFKTIELYY